MNLKYLKDRFLETLFPEGITCYACGTELKGERFGLCGDCFFEMPYITDDVRTCKKCGRPIYDEADYCLECQNHRFVFARVNSPFVYRGLAAKLIDDMKFRNMRYIAGMFGEFVATEYVRRNYAADLIVCTPAFERSGGYRGFNQSALIAEKAAKLLKLDARFDALIKTRETKHQALLTSFERRKNLVGAFKVIRPDVIADKSVLIIDDVITTGSTMNECAKALLKAKAREVVGLTACCTEFEKNKRKEAQDGADAVLNT
ncbi:MAG: ComF family protein [Clostridiales bacterium]|jgi:ComF family protein|nr:ComF family protein [Clostridiales bacterium]